MLIYQLLFYIYVLGKDCASEYRACTFCLHGNSSYFCFIQNRLKLLSNNVRFNYA